VAGWVSKCAGAPFGTGRRCRGAGDGRIVAVRRDHAMGVAVGWREVRDDPDGWVPPVGERVREGDVGVGRRN
jgi:hypothetical protein